MLAMLAGRSTTYSADWRELAPPEVVGRWLHPANVGPAQPVWGHSEGIQMGLHPMPGPRGLLRVYAPYLGQPEGRAINFVAVEPIPRGTTERGLSELESSRLDKSRGKRFWSSDSPHDPVPQPSDRAVTGWVDRTAGVECLRVWILVEPYDNGAHVYLRLTIRADLPYEVGIATFAHEDSTPLSHCIVTATMGNFARLRRLHLAEQTVLPAELWPTFSGNDFTPHARIGLKQLVRTPAGDAVVFATPNESRPRDASYAIGTRAHWHYDGDVATQCWRVESPDPSLEVLVNGRRVYWNSKAPIPGGLSYENFEMVAPFRQGEEFWFGVTPGPEP